MEAKQLQKHSQKRASLAFFAKKKFFFFVLFQGCSYWVVPHAFWCAHIPTAVVYVNAFSAKTKHTNKQQTSISYLLEAA